MRLFLVSFVRVCSILSLAALPAAPLACSSGVSDKDEPSEGEGEGEGEGDEPALTYYRDLKPLIEEKCLACHVTGGIAPFALDVPEDVVGMAAFLAAEVATKAMPPWPPSDLSPPMRDDISLDDDQIALFQEFAAIANADPEAALGDPADAAPPVPPTGFPLTNPDVAVTMPEAFTPRGVDTGEDEFRCFLLDLDVQADRMLVGFRFLPGNPLVDHHAIITLYSKDDLAALQQLDADEEGAGWSCFGEDVPADVALPVGRIGAWTPGNNGVVAYPGTGSAIPANVVAIISMHYNVTNAIGDDGTVDLSKAADRSGLELYFAAPEDEAGLVQVFGAGANLNPMLRANATPIPADDPAFAIERTTVLADARPGLRALLENAGIDTVYATGVGAHGHLILKHFEIIADEGGAAERVLLDIPAWDFDWQGQYTFVDAIPLPIETAITVRCTYDNSSENRARVGLDPTSVVVEGGEGTNDEMCIGGLQLIGQLP